MRAFLALGFWALAGCTFVLDWEDVEGLPCPCDPEHICLENSDRCVLRGSVELFKSCSTDTVAAGDELCGPNAVCENINNLGPRCLPICTPNNYATPDTGMSVANQCPQGTTCWSVPRGGGVCSEGICSELRFDCAVGEQCVSVNGAGICFGTCEIFATNPLPCAGDQLCHPVASSRVTACIPAGPRAKNEICSDTEFCQKTDAAGKPMICDRELGSNNPRRCLPICRDVSDCSGGERCAIARANLDPVTGASLGICISN